MKNIIYIGNFELPDKNAAAHRVVNNSKALRSIGHNITLIDTNSSYNDDILNSKKEYFGFCCFSMRHTMHRIISISDFKKVLSSLNYKVDIVIAYNYPCIALYKLKIFCKKNNIKLIADCTEWIGFNGTNFMKKILTGIDSYIRMNIIQPKLDGVIVISKYLENFYKEKTHTICIPPLVDLKEKKWECKVQSGHGDIKIVYAGNPGKHKDKLNIVIEALYYLNNKNVKLDIFGITKDLFIKYYPEDKSIIENLGKNIKFYGKIEHQKVIEIIMQADFSMFYRNINRVTLAGFPTKFSESISCGTPVITNKSSDLESYLVEGKNGYWLKDDLVNSLNSIFNDKNKIDIKSRVDKSIFDYNNYIYIFEDFINRVK